MAQQTLNELYEIIKNRKGISLRKALIQTIYSIKGLDKILKR